MKEYQVTLKCADGRYKPVSCIIKAEGADLKNSVKVQELLQKGTQKICIQRNWTKTELRKYNYTKGLVREYDKEKIDAQNKARYEKLKEEKYASGEWKRPKRREE